MPEPSAGVPSEQIARVVAPVVDRLRHAVVQAIIERLELLGGLGALPG